MNFNNYTIKSQEAIQRAQQLAQGFGHQQIENEHIFKALFDVDENVLPFLLKKLNVNVSLLRQILDKEIESFSKVSGADLMLSREAGKALTEASNPPFKGPFQQVLSSGVIRGSFFSSGMKFTYLYISL